MTPRFAPLFISGLFFSVSRAAPLVWHELYPPGNCHMSNRVTMRRRKLTASLALQWSSCSSFVRAMASLLASTAILEAALASTKIVRADKAKLDTSFTREKGDITLIEHSQHFLEFLIFLLAKSVKGRLFAPTRTNSKATHVFSA